MADVGSITQNVVEVAKTEIKKMGKTAVGQVTGSTETTFNNYKDKEKKQKRMQRRALLAKQQEVNIRGQLAAEAQKQQLETKQPLPQLKGLPKLTRIGDSGLDQQVSSKQAETSIGRKGE
jgi:hypothetical protein